MPRAFQHGVEAEGEEALRIVHEQRRCAAGRRPADQGRRDADALERAASECRRDPPADGAEADEAELSHRA